MEGVYRFGSRLPVSEVLFGRSATAVGRTSSITGTFHLSGPTVTAGAFTVDLTTVHSGRSQRDAQFQGRIMDRAGYPSATFILSHPVSLGALPASGVILTAQATGTRTLHGTT